jgi:hypothetical protein
MRKLPRRATTAHRLRHLARHRSLAVIHFGEVGIARQSFPIPLPGQSRSPTPPRAPMTLYQLSHRPGVGGHFRRPVRGVRYGTPTRRWLRPAGLGDCRSVCVGATQECVLHALRAGASRAPSGISDPVLSRVDGNTVRLPESEYTAGSGRPLDARGVSPTRDRSGEACLKYSAR